MLHQETTRVIDKAHNTNQVTPHENVADSKTDIVCLTTRTAGTMTATNDTLRFSTAFPSPASTDFAAHATAPTKNIN